MSNAEQIEYWNSKVGETWVLMQERMDLALTPVTTALLAAAAPQPGELVLDIGCGAGETTLAIDAVVGEGGHAIGLDVSEPLLARARERAEALLSEAEFIAADAATWAEESGFDLILSRFGVMFFADPGAAFANLHGLAAPGGRLVFACWQPAARNLWATLPMTALAHLLPAMPPSDPHAPGPFAFADPARVATLLEAAGWQDLAFHSLPFEMMVGDGDDPIASAVQFNLRIGPAARAVRDAGIGDAAKPILAEALTAFLQDGQVRLPGAIWLVTARA
ncbi:methyltransferase domain-containing protein [Sandarakinorhabdus sp. AAP62]|uniref:class I SAM-dependent methyltransferase n=1 Tax=Sandarakinorhabdus sp. AAP62 TaxID=1248916 RepID=UPI0002D73A4B|nr:methyltransferase domain-containing protein [Sandarakinorhabdus sp. AAP62]